MAKKTKTKRLKHFILTKSDLLKIFRFLERKRAALLLEMDSLTPPLPKSAKKVDITVTVNSQGDVTTEDSDGKIFDDDVIDNSKTNEINFSYRHYGSNLGLDRSESITISLSTVAMSDSKVTISGDNAQWVDATFAEFETLEASFKPHINLIEKYWWAFYPVFGISAAVAIVWLVLLVKSDFKSIPNAFDILLSGDNSIAGQLDKALALAFLGIFPGSAFFIWSKYYLPPIEFDFGPEHLKTRKRMRIHFYALCTLIFVPFIYDLFKRVLLGWQ